MNHPVPSLTPFLEQVHDRLFAEFPLWQDEAGQVWGRVFKNQLGSAYVPVQDAQGQRLGMAGLTRVSDSTDTPLAAEALFRLVRDEGLVRLDRFCRTLHVLNRPPAAGLLFLPIHAGLPRAVSSDHGQVFEHILHFLGLGTADIVITVPAGVVAEPELATRISHNYRHRGYRVAWTGVPDGAPFEPDWWLQLEPGRWQALAGRATDL